MHLSRPLFLLCLALASCAPSGAQVTDAARQQLVGMDVSDLQACAGIPNRTQTLGDGTRLLSYEQKNENVGGLNISLPVVGGFSLAGSGTYCHVLVRVAQNRVIGLNYTGDNDDVGGQNGVCAPIVRGCVRQPVPAYVPPELTPQPYEQ
ncbi:hypothetical protein IBL26_16465 [Roseomonas aerophila]|uniref:Lipoprotein n=1 Tax=Teichococcus aerophilus TaxID=1224513 RepID=A0ABR7RPF1_9PROT|nr:hypothetical protein [Pseudoroseomonas aerophila]MBC9208442.1 hypothetical protein [Pseudoroseomonas aerophila]